MGFGTISYNNALTSLSGLNNLTTINGSNFSVVENNSLTSLSALNSLTYVKWLNVYENPLLTSLSGLENLTSTEGFNVNNNSLLTDISALQNIDPTTIIIHPEYGLHIFDNPLLSVCNLPNICTYLQGTGYREIYGNSGDCISESAVVTACALSVRDIGFSQIKLYPNPVESRLFLEREVKKITITDLTGKVLTTQNNSNQIDMSDFSNGVYLITIETENNTTEIKKIVKG